MPPPFLCSATWRDLLKTMPFLVVITAAAALSFAYHDLLRRQRDLVEHTYAC